MPDSRWYNDKFAAFQVNAMFNPLNEKNDRSRSFYRKHEFVTVPMTLPFATA